MLRCAKALAWLRGDQYVTPEHIYYEEFVDGNVLKYKIVGK
jgi:hypothetical protein